MGYKKFEPYINGKKIGTIKVNWDSLRNKYLAGTLATIMTVVSLTGCSFAKKVNVQENITETKLEFDNLEEEIKEKQHFVESVLQELYEVGNQPPINQIMEPYKEMKNIEYDIDPINEYSAFYTEEEKHNKKQQINLCLTSAINIIETRTFYQYGIDFIDLNKSK